MIDGDIEYKWNYYGPHQIKIMSKKDLKLAEIKKHNPTLFPK